YLSPSFPSPSRSGAWFCTLHHRFQHREEGAARGWHRLCAQGSASVPPYAGHRPAPARSFPRRDRRTAPPSKSQHNRPLCQGGFDRIAQPGPSLAGRCAMKTVREAVGDYLALRRSLEFKLKKHQRFLEEFASFLEQESTSQITSRLALLWATQPKHIQPGEWAARLSVVRGFAHYWSATDATTEVPPDSLLPYRPRRAKPYLYSEEQIHQLLETAKNMSATHSLQPWT